MLKTIVVLAVVVGLAGLQLNAEARGGKGGGNGSGNGSGGTRSVSQGGGGGMQVAGGMNRYQHQKRLQVQDGTQLGAASRTQQRQQLRDPALHTTPLVAPPSD